METAKVDIRKLQVLNDRISQCIDALNQVRLSVHGLSHTTPAVPFISPGLSPLTGLNPLAQVPFGQVPFGLGYGGIGQIPLSQAYVPGFSHTTPYLSATQAAFLPGVVPGFNALAGLSHTSPEEAFLRPAWADPFLAARIAQTFPYAQYPFPPVVTIF